MQQQHPHIIRNNHFWISPQRCLFWEEQNSLVIADMHLGKTGHFRKSGIAVPQTIYKADLQRLMSELYFFKADRLVIVGDLTHSTANKELDLFRRWRKDFSGLKIDLVKGNHDILKDNWYEETDITVTDELIIENFCFRHDLEKCNNNLYTFSGHMHPGISLKGGARQTLSFPCFYFMKNQCILPAFSHFTGIYKVQPARGESVFAIVENKIMQIS